MTFQAGDRVRWETTAEDGLPLIRYGFVGYYDGNGHVTVMLDGDLTGDTVVDLSQLAPVSITSVELCLSGADLLDDPSLRQGLVNLWSAEVDEAGLEIRSLERLGNGVKESDDGFALAQLWAGSEQYVLRASRDDTGETVVVHRRRRATLESATSDATGRGQLRRSMIIAMPWPPPTHIVSRPYCLSASWRPWISVVMMRAPVMPNGWPRAIEPPLTLSLSHAMPRCLADGMTCAANASLISTRSMSSIVMPARVERLTAGLDRAEAHDLRVERRDARRHDAGERREAELVRLRVAHHEHRRGAVVERAGVAGGDLAVGAEHRLELASPSTVVPARGPSSFATTVPSGSVSGVISSLPEAVLDVGDGALLRERRELVHLLAGDALALDDVLGGLAHRDVDVGQALRRRPRPAAPPWDRSRGALARPA